MFDKTKKIFLINQNQSFDTCPACQKKIDRSEINITAQHVYVKIEAQIDHPIAALMGVKATQVISCLAHNECIEEFTDYESKSIYVLKPEKYQEILVRGGR